MRGYKHLTWHDRLKIDKLKREGKKQKEIAAALHVSESTISRASIGESIEKRPETVNDRSEFGHWEMDLVESCRAGRGYLLVLTERQTRQEITAKLPNKQPSAVISALNRLERKWGARFRRVFKSITMDNGGEFSDCRGIERSIYGGRRTRCYYCHPYSSYERGSNEKQNQLLRRHFPKGTDFDKITESEVRRVTDWLNNYPRKLLDWQTSGELFDKAVNSL